MGSDKMESRRAMGSLFDMLLRSYTYYSSPRWVDLSSSEKKHVVADDEGLVESPDDLMAMGSMKSIDSGVSFKSDRSKAETTDFKDRVSPSEMDFSSSEEEDVSDDGFSESPDDLSK